jgi:hypothetical protein
MRMSSQPAPVVLRARALATELLAGDPGLLEHSSRAALHAARLTRAIPGSSAPDVTAAAWLHDIGYAPGIQRTGFHPLDGALYLMAEQWPERIVRLVAHHSLAALEAPFYGVGHHLSVIEPVPGVDADILISADLRSGTGDPQPTAEERLDALRSAALDQGLVPVDIVAARSAGLRTAHERVNSLVD